MLHSALDRAVKERLLIRNPADSCVVPKVQRRETKNPQPENLKAYLDAAERRGSLAMFYLELVSGIRKASWRPCNGQTWTQSGGPSPSAGRLL